MTINDLVGNSNSALGSSPIDRLISAILQQESRPKIALEAKKTALNRKQTVLTDLDSKLSSLNSLAERLTSKLADYFAAKTAASSNAELLTVSAGGSASLGSHDITIQSLASIDTRVSQQYTATGTDLQSVFAAEAQTFQIEVAHPIEGNSDNRVSIQVRVDSTGLTNNEILDEIAAAINSSFDSAASAGTIDSDEKVVASVVHEENGTSRLVLRSGKSGYTNRLNFTDSANSLLSTLQVNSASQSTGTAGGYITTIGTSASDSELNAAFVIDGLTFYRDSNAVNDALDGVTLNLLATTTTNESFQVNADVEAVRKEVEDFLTAYNEVIVFIKGKTSFDSELKVRGDLSGDGIYRSLRSSLRNVMTSQITGVESGNPEYLSEIGITALPDGTLSFSDDEKFRDALATGSSAISKLFNTTDGIATQVDTLLENFIKVGGFIDDSKRNIDDRIKNIDTRISRMDELLLRRESQLRIQFSRMQQVAALLQNQQSMLQSIFSAVG